MSSGKNIELRVGESERDYCLLVGLNKSPGSLDFPSDYEGLRVVYLNSD